MSIDEKIFDSSWASVEKVEIRKCNNNRVTLQAKYGKYSVEVSDKVATRLKVGDTLETAFVLVPSGLTDFIGQKPEPGDVVTASYELAYLRIPGSDYKEPEYIYRRKNN